MASFTVAQSSQTRPTSESNNKNNSNCNNQKNICTTEDNNNNKSNNKCNGITKTDYEYVKFKQDNIDPGATTTTTTTTNYRANEFVFTERDRSSNNSDTIEAIAKIIGDNFSAQYWPTEDLSNSQTSATNAANATAATTEEEYKLTTATKSTLNSENKPNNTTECLSNQGTLFTRLAIQAANTETEFANKEKLKLGDINVPIGLRRTNSKQSKYDYAINANAKANANINGEYVDRHRLLDDRIEFHKSQSDSGAKQEFGDNISSELRQSNRQLYEFVCAITTTTTIAAFICAIYANANANTNANATTKNTSRHGWDSVDRCRRAHVARVHEWSNAYCYS